MHFVVDLGPVPFYSQARNGPPCYPAFDTSVAKFKNFKPSAKVAYIDESCRQKFSDFSGFAFLFKKS